MKKIKSYLFIALAALFMSASIPGCSNGPDYDGYVYPQAQTREKLGVLISDCTELISNVKVGNMEGEYLPYVIGNFRSSIEESKKIYSNDKATQAMIDRQFARLNSAKALFLESVNRGDLDPNDESLVLHLRFNGNIIDASSLGHLLTLSGGNALCGNGAAPSFTQDRWGNEGQAMHFEKGGHISIPFVEGQSESLNPEVMTFMCWVRENKSIPVQSWLFCLDTWNIFYVVIPAGGSEFQFGGQTTRGWIDPLMNSGVNASSNWTHLTVTYAPSGVSFYKNGELIRSYAGLGNLVKNGTKKPFFIGAMDSERELYFEGDLDEFRLYNKVLSAQEVLSVFNLEKPSTMIVDKTALKVSVEAAKAVRDEAKVGFKIGEYLQSVMDVFMGQISEAEALYDNKNATQNQADKMAKELDEKSVAFVEMANVRNFDSRLMLHLSFDGTTDDASFHAYKVMAMESTVGLPPYPAIDRYGRYDGAYHFDKGSYFSIPFDAGLNPQETTYMFWIKAADPCGAGDPYLLSINRRFCFYAGLKGGEFVFGGAGSDGNIPETTSGVRVSNGWQHIALSYSSESGVALYVDGLLVKSASGKGALARVTNDTPFVIGVKGSSDHQISYFRGDMDEIRIYDCSLDAAEITEIYNQQKP